MKFLVGILVFVVGFSFVKAIASPSDLDSAFSNTKIIQEKQQKEQVIASFLK